MPNRFPVVLDKIIEYLIKALVFILPLFFLPWTFEFFEFNKQYLLWLVVPLLVILWIVRIVKQPEGVIFKRTFLDIPIITFLIISLLAVIFSQDKFSSFFGYYGRFSDAWLGLFSLGIFYFIIVNFVKVRGYLSIISLIKLLIYSYGIILISAFLAIFGLGNRIIGDTNFFSSPAFNFLSGSLEALAVYSVAMVSLLIGLLFFYYKKDNKHIWGTHTRIGEIWLFKIILFLALVFLVLVNLSIAWWVLFVFGLIFLFIKLKYFSFKDRKINKVIIWFLASCFLAVSFLIMANINLDYYLTGQKLPQEVRLDHKNTVLITLESLKDNLILGSGPGTFAYNFSLYREPSFNYSEFWQFRFDKGSSYILEIIGTLGILGGLSYFLILSVFFYSIYIFIKKILSNKEIKRERIGLVLTLIITAVILILLQFLYLANTGLLFLFWIILAFIMILWNDLGLPLFRDLRINLGKTKFWGFRARISVIVVFLIMAGWLILAGFEIKYWLADFYARRGGESNLIKATRLNPGRVNYQVSLAKYYLNKLKTEIIKPVNFRDNNLIQDSIDNSIRWARAAEDTYPNSVMVQETIGMVYRDVRFLTRGSESWAAKAFLKATTLEPSNPVLLTELGKVYVHANMLEEAIQSFGKALELKDDYLEAKFGLTRVYIRQKKDKEALIILNELAEIYENEEVYYEQGRLYYNQGETEKALEKFIKVIEINPNHSNALYNIGLALELKGEERLALEYFKRVLELNPGNVEVKKKVEQYYE